MNKKISLLALGVSMFAFTSVPAFSHEWHGNCPKDNGKKFEKKHHFPMSNIYSGKIKSYDAENNVLELIDKDGVSISIKLTDDSVVSVSQWKKRNEAPKADAEKNDAEVPTETN